MWQLIETAPRDATAILVMRDIWPGARSGRAEECNGRNTYVAAWWPDERGGQGAWICYMDAVLDPECPVEPTHWMPLPDAPGAQPAPSFADAYQGAMEEVAIWKKRALEAEELNRKFIAEINGPTHMGEPAQPMPNVPDSWKLVPAKHPTFDPVDLQLSDGSVLCGCVPQLDGDYWWEGPSGEVFIDPKYASVTHWRLAALEAKP